jgi:hypothetical protein
MADTGKGTKHRSPAYPFIALRKAVERAQQLYERNKRHPAPMAVAAGLWGYKEKSSGGLQTVSALKQYGLLRDEGSGEDRQVRLTDLALSILLDDVPNSPERAAAIKQAATRPKLFAEMVGKWGVELPNDETIRTYLKRDKGFNDDAVSGVIKDFKDTIEYAKLTDSDKITSTDDDGTGVPDSVYGGKVQEIQQLRDGKPSADGLLSLSVPYGAQGSVLTVNIKLAGERLKPAHIAKVRRYLELAEADLTDESE